LISTNHNNHDLLPSKLLPAKPSDSGRNAPKSSQRSLYGTPNVRAAVNSSPEKMCCDGKGKVISDEHVKQFE
jgi:hypothetical protein